MLQTKLPLGEEELQSTLRRAREIAQQGTAAAPSGDLELYLTAAEEMGIPREALAQALRERNLLPPNVQVGEQYFAPSADGFWYVARVREVNGADATVEFAGGGERSCALVDLRPLDLVPGRRLQVDWPDWGWTSVEVNRHDPKKGKVKVTSWLQPTTVSLAKLRLHPNDVRSRQRESGRGLLLRWTMAAGGAGFALGVLAAKVLPMLLPFLR
jgi:hypothetical protein